MAAWCSSGLGKFRRSYEKPYNQLIVGDGSKLWSYDKELNQVVIKPMTVALGSSPAALLAGDNALEKNFDLKDGGENGGLAWLDATPKNNEAGFECVRIGFKGGLPQSMEVRDNFGQTTMLQFAGFERNVTVTADTFHFVPPKQGRCCGRVALRLSAIADEIDLSPDQAPAGNVPLAVSCCVPRRWQTWSVDTCLALGK